MTVRSLGAVFIVGISLFSPFAESHTRLLTSDPQAGQVLSRAPDRISLTFSTPVEATFSQLELSKKHEKTGPHEKTWQGLKVNTDGHTITGALPQLTPAKYRIRWRVLARDGHIQRGQFSFELR